MKARMYYQDSYEALYDFKCSPRIRILYPNGIVEWFALDKNFSNEFETPCWMWGRNKCSMNKLIKLMHQYDAQNGWKKAEFIGYL